MSHKQNKHYILILNNDFGGSYKRTFNLIFKFFHSQASNINSYLADVHVYFKVSFKNKDVSLFSLFVISFIAECNVK